MRLVPKLLRRALLKLYALRQFQVQTPLHKMPSETLKPQTLNILDIESRLSMVFRYRNPNPQTLNILDIESRLSMVFRYRNPKPQTLNILDIESRLSMVL